MGAAVVLFVIVVAATAVIPSSAAIVAAATAVIPSSVAIVVTAATAAIPSSLAIVVPTTAVITAVAGDDPHAGGDQSAALVDVASHPDGRPLGQGTADLGRVGQENGRATKDEQGRPTFPRC
jgi:hypothetical protein